MCSNLCLIAFDRIKLDFKLITDTICFIHNTTKMDMSHCELVDNSMKPFHFLWLIIHLQRHAWVGTVCIYMYFPEHQTDMDLEPLLSYLEMPKIDKLQVTHLNSWSLFVLFVSLHCVYIYVVTWDLGNTFKRRECFGSHYLQC